MTTEFHFLRPEWLWGFSVFLLLPFLMSRGKTAGGAWRAVCDRFLLNSQLVAGSERQGRFFPLFLAVASWSLAVLALAGPAWERLPQPVLKQGTDTVFLWDISRFMSVADLKPSRTARARFKLYDFLKHADGGQYALILYDNEPFVAVPLTSDVKVIENVLPTVQAGMMGGSAPDPALALEKAGGLLKGAKSPDGNIVLLGSFVGDDKLKSAVKAAEKLEKEGYSVSVLGLGTKQGAPVQMPDGTFLSDRNGKPLLSALSEKGFKDIAAAGGGLYRRASLDDGDVKAVSALRSDGRPDFKNLKEEMQKADAWKDVGIYLTLLILPFAALGFRRGWLGVFLFYFVLSTPARAFSWQDVFERPDRREALNIQAGKAATDPSVFDDNPAWQGAAQYKAGQFPDAVQTLSGAADADTLYNLGNAQAFAGQIPQAIETYKKALQLDPKHEDAAFNKKYLEEELKKQQQQNQQQNQQQQQQNQQQQNQQQNQQEQNQQQNASDQNQQSQPNGGDEADRNQGGEQDQKDNGGKGDQNSDARDNGEENDQSSASEKNSDDRNGNSEQAANQESEQGKDEKDETARENASASQSSQNPENPEPSREQPAAGTASSPRDDKEAEKEQEGRFPASGTETPEDKEKQQQKEWLSVIDDDPSGLLRERIRRRNARRTRMW